MRLRLHHLLCSTWTDGSHTLCPAPCPTQMQGLDDLLAAFDEGSRGNDASSSRSKSNGRFVRQLHQGYCLD